MKNRKDMLLAMLLVGAMALAACSPGATPTATTQPTLTPPTAGAPTTEAPTAEPEQPVGGVDVAWENVIQPEGDAVASVNGAPVSTEAYLEELRQQLHSVTANYGLDWYDEQTVSYLPAFQDQVLQQLINQELAGQLAAAEGITVTAADVEAELAKVEADIVQSGEYESWEAFLDANGLTQADIEQDLKNYLLYQGLVEAHGGSAEAEQVHAAHILVDSEETGQEVLDKLAAGEVFADLAQEYSTDPGSGAQGGDLGWFPRGVMVSEFEEVAFGLEIGEISGLVQSQFGYHIIQLLGKETRPLDEAMLEQAQQENFQAWFAEQSQAAEIDTLVQFEAPT